MPAPLAMSTRPGFGDDVKVVGSAGVDRDGVEMSHIRLTDAAVRRTRDDWNFGISNDGGPVVLWIFGGGFGLEHVE